MNILVPSLDVQELLVHRCARASLVQGKDPEAELLGHIIYSCLTLCFNSKLFSKVAVLISRSIKYSGVAYSFSIKLFNRKSLGQTAGPPVIFLVLLLTISWASLFFYFLFFSGLL